MPVILKVSVADDSCLAMEKKRIGRPPGGEYGDLIHVRIPTELREKVDAARLAMPQRPSLANFVRDALANEVKRMERGRS